MVQKRPSSTEGEEIRPSSTEGEEINSAAPSELFQTNYIFH